MKAKVRLTFDKVVGIEEIKEAKSIAEFSTPDKRTISAKVNEEDDKVLEVIFKRVPGRQTDIVDSIYRPFRLYMENLNDIAIFFETRKKMF